MTKDITLPLIAETDQLLASIKRNYLAIAANLYRIKNGREWAQDEWVEFYKSRDLKKSAVSKFLKVGEWVIAHNMTKEAVSYDKLYLSINRNPEKDPKYVLAEAKTWHDDDYKAQAKEDCLHLKPAITVCPDCWKQV